MKDRDHATAIRMTDAPDGQRDFFVSFNRADRNWATWISWTLEDAGYSVFFQDWDFAGNFVLKMHDAIKRSPRMVAVLSPDYLASLFTAPEWAAVFRQDPTSARDFLVPVRVRECEPDGLLAQIVYLDITASTREQARELLLKRVSGERPKPGEEPPFPIPGAPLPPAARTVKQEPRFPGIIHNLPPCNPDFVGREEELGRLLDLLVADEPVVLTQAITGLGGIGKTQTALAYAHRHLAGCRLVWWLKAEQPATLAADYAAMAEPLGLPAVADQPKQVEAVRQALEGMGGWLLVFDNVNDPVAVQRDYFPRRGDGRVLLTSRRTDWRGVAKALPLDVLPEADAVALLSGGAQAGVAEPAEAAALAKELGCLPLALTQAHAYLVGTGRSFAEYRALLAARRADLLRRGVPNDYKLPVLLTWEPSLEAAEKECLAARPLLELLAFFAADPLPRAMLAADPEALPEPLRDPLALDDAVAALARFSLVTAAQGMLTVHRLVQAVTLDGLDGSIAKAWAEIGTQLVMTAMPIETDYPSEWPKVQALLPHALAIAGHAEQLDAGLPAAALILNQVALYHKTRAAWADAEPLYKRAITISEKALGSEHPSLAGLLNNIAVLYQATGRYAEAEPLYKRALAITEKALGPEHPVFIRRLSNLAELYRATDRDAKAEPLLERAAAITEKAFGPEHPDLAIALNNLGSLRRDTGRYAEAEPLYKRAAAITEKAFGPEHPDLAIRLSNLAWLYAKTGRLAAAEPLYKRALAIDEKAYGPDHPKVATRLHNLAGLYAKTGRLAAAEPLFNRALTIQEKSLPPDHPNLAMTCESYAVVLAVLGRGAEAAALRARAEAIRQRRTQPPSPLSP